MVGADSKPLFREAAKRRQEAGQKAGGKARHGKVSSGSNLSPSKVNEQAASLVNVGSGSVKAAVSCPSA